MGVAGGVGDDGYFLCGLGDVLWCAGVGAGNGVCVFDFLLELFRSRCEGEVWEMINPGFSFSDVVAGVNSFLAMQVVSGILVGIMVLGLVGTIAATLYSLVSRR